MLYRCGTLLTLVTTTLAEDRHFHFDSRSAFIDGQRTLILSGAVHYSRVPVGDWSRVLAEAKGMGLNTVQTYFMWNFHERVRGEIDWSGRRNLTHFISLAHAQGLLVALRIGPYICGEYQFGGLPAWLRTLDDVQCFRCSDPVWKRESQRIVSAVVDRVRPLLASNGGPIMMLQIENEYKGPDEAYLQWAVDMARHTTAGSSVPWLLCHDHALCARVNHQGSNGTYAYRALCSVNGFWMEEYEANPGQPSPKWLADLRLANPGQPAIWTEDQGWFDKWEYGKRVREPSDQIYGVARWFAFGGSWHNFYMLTGGNNYGRQAGGTVVTAYAPDTPIDSFFLRHEPRYTHYGNFFNVLRRYEKALLASPIAPTTTLECAAAPGPAPPTPPAPPPTIELGHCSDDDPAHIGKLDVTQHFTLTAAGELRHVDAAGHAWCLLLDAGVVPKIGLRLSSCSTAVDSAPVWRFNATSRHIESVASVPCVRPETAGLCHQCLDLKGGSSALDLWDCKLAGDLEPSNQRFDVSSKASEGGIFAVASGLCLTAVATDASTRPQLHEYGDLAFLSNPAEHGPACTVSYRGASYALPLHTVVLVDTATSKVVYNTSCLPTPPPVAPASEAVPTGWQVWHGPAGGSACVHTTTAAAPLEQLGVTKDATDYLWYTANVSASVAARAGPPKINVEALGGTITYASLSGRELRVLSVAMGLSNGGVGPQAVKGVRNVTVNGEAVTGPFRHSWMMQPEVDPSSLKWAPVTGRAQDDLEHVWFRGHVDLPPPSAVHERNGSQTAYALDLSTMNKGFAYVNGWDLGRYWLVPGKCSGACAPPVKSGHCYEHWKDCGKPTQTLYHVPTEVLRPTANEILLFEETANTVQRRELRGVRLRALHEHAL